MRLEIDDKLLHDQIVKIVGALNLTPMETLKGRTITMEQFRRNYCGKKQDLWVRTFIFDKFPETNYENGGWVLHPHPRAEGAGRSTIIFAYAAAKWMEAHRKEIDWNARLSK